MQPGAALVPDAVLPGAPEICVGPPAPPTPADPAAGAVSLPPELQLELESRIVQTRLGVASSLFAALQARHGPSAAHCLRVALGCSTWAAAVELPGRERDYLEIAALL